ncbi:hypothetical protein H5410_033102 [Solanum commersonii]|uniref:FAD-binding PCMH-type domain-containing protein n=1 Tax=Solanum commersonii TaxID=4109 RepID=A0A9J5YRL6_SOLCO|nr:hypothetical protein H5410_033102 [Solanum commersonii]
MSWIESIMYFAGFPIDGSLDVLLSRVQPTTRYFKAKSDYVHEAKSSYVILTPYDGRMDEISASDILFPHRTGNLYKIQHSVYWDEEGEEVAERHISWIRRLYSYMAPFVSMFPRAAYINYRDLAIGMNNKKGYSYMQAKVWVIKYFKNNFDRLVHVKTKKKNKASWSALADNHEEFIQCLSHSNQTSSNIYTPNNSSFPSILQFSIQNLRFNTTETPKPLVIVTPVSESEVQRVILCAKKTGMHVRVRGAGHDYEGLSYVSEVPFVIVDLINLRTINVDVNDKSAWVEAGSTIGELYYRIAEKSKTLGFPAGVCPTVGVGGHFSGGGYGVMLRKYGLAADNIVDARLIDAKGRILDRASMGEDLFWAIRGGGGNSFGLVLAWKIKLVDVPEIVTVFTLDKTLEQNATKLVHRWQYVAPRFHEDLFIRILVSRLNSSNQGGNNQQTIVASFNSIFLGGIDRLLPIMQENFPELGLRREDCIEMSWIESIMYFAGFPTDGPLDVLLSRVQLSTRYFKAKSDYVYQPIPEGGLEGIWRYFFEDEAKSSQVILSPYGGRMDEISASAIPFPHRAGNLYKIQHLVYWDEEGEEVAERHISWIRRLYSYMAPFVSKLPRAAYINYRDLDIGVNNIKGYTSYVQAKVWGIKYFKNNFDRLVHVKTKVDPSNFFRNEQSIPSLTQWKNKGE